MPAKSRKADGTAKVRWSAADRAARGHAPRRRGGQPRKGTVAVSPEVGRHPARPAAVRPAGKTRSSSEQPPVRKPRTVRPERRERPESRTRPEWSARPDRGERTDRSEQRPRTEWNARPPRGERPERPEPRQQSDWKARPERGERVERSSQRPRGEWDARPERAERPERSEQRPRTEWNARPERGERPERSPQRQRPAWGARPERGERFARPEQRRRPDRSDRSERPDRSERFERPEPTPSSGVEPMIPVTPPPAVPGAEDFAALGLSDTLVTALAESGIATPFAIQAATVPAALAGRDVLGRAQTGSGKTLAFGLPMLARLAGAETQRGRAPRGLVLTPTRELAMQVTDVLIPLAQSVGLGVVLVAGGMSYTPQQRAFERGVDIVVATPGRLIDLLDQGVVDLGLVEVTVLDEADHMADLGFMPAVTQILDTVPEDGQRLLFSATLDGAVDQLVRRYLPDPVTVSVDAATASVATMAHLIVPVAPAEKTGVTAGLAARPGRAILFVRTQLGADRVAEQLRAAGVLAGALHGGLAQGLRTRILAAFRDGTLPTLVATDVAARGIHVDDVGLVLQVDPPHGSKEYLHRAGRTARAGGKGQVVTLVLPHQRREVSRLLERAGVRHVDSANPGDPQLRNDGATPGAPIPEADYLRLVAPPAARPHGRRRSAPRRSRY